MVLEVQGLLDEPALGNLGAAVALARASGAEVRVVLRSGVEVERACVPALRALGGALTVESPYLAAWIAGGGP